MAMLGYTGYVPPDYMSGDWGDLTGSTSYGTNPYSTDLYGLSSGTYKPVSWQNNTPVDQGPGPEGKYMIGGQWVHSPEYTQYMGNISATGSPQGSYYDFLQQANSGMGSPFAPALVMMGGAAAGGAFGGGSPVPGASGSGTATTFPVTPTGPIGVSPAAGGGAAAGAGAGGALASGSAATGLGTSLGSLGLPGWLTVGSTIAGALQGNKPITSTSTNDPPAYLKPYLEQAAGAAQNQFANGSYVSPFQQSAVGYGTNVLNGSYLNSNPYLDATFNKAAGAVTNQVQSNFGLAGRNPRGPDAAGLATDKYNELATQIYGGNYQAERDRQQQVLPMTGMLGTIGNPMTALDDYIARLRNIGGGYGSQTSTTPTQSNPFSALAGLGLYMMGRPGG